MIARALLGLLLAGVLASGCATVQPWERGVMMRRAMQASVDPLADAFLNHVRTTRESMAGATLGGGLSCGCN